jgi:DNA-binding response OmpR family regulator
MLGGSVITSISPSPVSPTQLTDLLLVDASTDAAGYAGVLRASYRVATTTSSDVARQFLRRQAPGLVITELDLPGGDGVEVCREAKRLTLPPPVLVTTVNADRVPDALSAGCDGVLLKPFAPNLLFARIGRLLRARSEMLRARARNQGLKNAHLADRSEALLGGTNRVWPNTHCPYCNHGGVTSFEFCSHRRAWYACLQCRKVWIAKRLE